MDGRARWPRLPRNFENIKSGRPVARPSRRRTSDDGDGAIDRPSRRHRLRHVGVNVGQGTSTCSGAGPHIVGEEYIEGWRRVPRISVRRYLNDNICFPRGSFSTECCLPRGARRRETISSKAISNLNAGQRLMDWFEARLNHHRRVTFVLEYRIVIDIVAYESIS